MTAILLLKVVLKLSSPGGVAAPEQLTEIPNGVQVPLAQTHGDNPVPYVPATSLAGSFRAHLGELADKFMGKPPEAMPITASALWFIGTEVRATEKVTRARTAIDRFRGSAAVHTLRKHERLGTGTEIVAYLRLDNASLRDELLSALATWTPTVGGGRTIGLGRATVTEVRERTIDLTTPDGRRTWLTTGGPDLFADEVTAPVPLSPPPEQAPILRLDWDIVDGLHIGNGESETGPDGSLIAKLARDRAEDGRPYVPGSTWKGVLRSRCEFILRSLGARACAPASRPGDTDDSGAARPCGDCLLCRAFGFVDAGKDRSSRRGLLVFLDSAIVKPVVITQRHVALDRVFGGARPNALFTEEVVTEGRLTLEVHATDSVAPEVLALLTLACQDIHHGFVGIGASTTRGLGTLRLLKRAEVLQAERAAAIRVLTTALGASLQAAAPTDKEVVAQ